MKQISKTLMTHLAEMVFLAGAAAIAVGAGMIYLPAGLIAGGVLAMTGAVLSSVGSGGDGT